MKILVIAGVHGNEKFGLKVLAELEARESRDITLRIAHPEAIAKNKRFIEEDLNRSFGSGRTTIEGRIASRLRAEILASNPDLIIDLHTSTVDVGLVAITAQHNEFLSGVAKRLSIPRMAVMLDSIASQALIGQNPEKSLCIEVGAGLRSNRLARLLAERIHNLLSYQSVPQGKVEIYKIRRLISKRDAGKSRLVNYEYCPSLKGYPFLAGEKNYTDYSGFLADRRVEV